MSRKTFLSIILTSILSTFNLLAFTSTEAFQVVKNLYPNEDCDFFLVEDNGSSDFVFFVDPTPLKGWKHECYLVSVPKNSSSINAANSSVTVLDMPPADNMTSLQTINRYGINALDKPMVASANGEENPVAQRTFAIILSGGINKNSNHQRYWNDCSFIYQTLTKTYGIPKSNMYVIMSDGTDPAEDMRLTTGGYASSPLDLDDDGLADIGYAATKSDIADVLDELIDRVEQDDQLFLFVIDHGGSYDENAESSYICLWNGEDLSDTELASMLNPFVSKNVTVNAVLGQCYSGGFLFELAKEGCVVTTACSASESSYACARIPYDEFVYHWTSAINKFDPYGNSTAAADLDENGMITTFEAFTYAQENDARSETPQFWANPATLGQLAFDNLIPTIGLYIKDNWNDFGLMPNRSTENFWDSPYIWTRNAADPGNQYEFQHENPYCDSSHLIDYLYVKVQNYGKKTYPGHGKFLHTNWVKASTAIVAGDWYGRRTDEDDIHNMGGLIGKKGISDVIEPGNSTNIMFRWLHQDDFNDITESIDGTKQHVCLLARIKDDMSDLSESLDFSFFDVIGDNTIAQKNLSIIPAYQTPYGIRVSVKNTSLVSNTSSLEFVPRAEYDEEMFAQSNVQIELGPQIYNAWRRGGSKLVRAQPKSFSVTNPDNFVIELTSGHSKIEGLNFGAKEHDVVSLKFDFENPPLETKVFTYDLIQRDAAGNIIGGETFKIISPISSGNEVQVQAEPLNVTNYRLSADDSFSSYIWRDANGEKLGIGESVDVELSSSNNTYNVTAISPDGKMATATVSLAQQHRLKDVNASNNGTGDIVVTLHAPAPANSALTVSSISNGRTVYRCECEIGESTQILQTDVLPQDVFVITYSVEGVVVDSKKLGTH